mmetsp:Transcript_37638/g.56018  ORF Transcript_37638/g.56018 Transcript_37638/m.56018 type:complete len:90 (-) Transcript_37638:103-372(-)
MRVADTFKERTFVEVLSISCWGAYIVLNNAFNWRTLVPVSGLPVGFDEQVLLVDLFDVQMNGKGEMNHPHEYKQKSWKRTRKQEEDEAR